MIEVGIVGGTGYTGAELLRLLARHPRASVRVLTSRQVAGQRADALFPHLRGICDLSFVAPDPAALAACKVVFFATPHGAAMALVPDLLRRGVRVIDLSADFRFRNAETFERWYRQPHTAPELLAEAVYGLPEVNRDAIRAARLLASPGCYPTAVQLGLLPLVRVKGLLSGTPVASCTSGVSGAGRELKLGSLFAEAADNVKAYGVAGHRHLPEIEQGLAAIAGAPVSLTFVPHLVPALRGIHATIIADLSQDVDVQALFERAYADEPFVDVFPPGFEPETRSVRGTNDCRIAIQKVGPRRVVVMSVIDNLVKGAAGQAIQCFNLMHALPETSGLDAPALWP